MARTKEFDKDAVVLKAMDVFWQRGYEATSIQDLVDAMGINRGSIYDTFGDKSGLFQAALQRYLIDAPSQRLIDQAETGNPRKEIEAFFKAIIDRSDCPRERKGCFVTNSIAELCARDKKMAAHFKGGMNRMEEAFYTLIVRGQQDWDISPWRNPRQLARSLLASAQGLIVMSKVGPGRETLEDIAATALSLLD